ncbi:MAG TPA: hypothetical protein VEG34_07085 [Thermoanaerobaculia bacterium]|nr:hypothetical protein [Thermoanaerobaculia bacterium]
MSQKLEITLVFESEQVQYYKGDIVSDLIPVRVGTALIQIRLENLSDQKVEFARLDWVGGQPDFIKDDKVNQHLIVIRDENEKDEQRGNFSFLPILRIIEKADRPSARKAGARREIPGPDPTIINTDIPGGVATTGRIRRVA